MHFKMTTACQPTSLCALQYSCAISCKCVALAKHGVLLVHTQPVQAVNIAVDVVAIMQMNELCMAQSDTHALCLHHPGREPGAFTIS